MLESTKKDTPHADTEKKPQQDGKREAIIGKSSPIPTGRVTHRLEKSNTKEILALLWRFWTPCQSSQPGDLTKGLGILRESDLEGQITGLPQDWGKLRLQCWRAHTQFCMHRDSEERSRAPQETDPNLPAGVGGPPAEVWGGRADHRGPGPWKGSLGINPLGGCHWPTTELQTRGLGHLRPNNYQGGGATPPISK